MNPPQKGGKLIDERIIQLKAAPLAPCVSLHLSLSKHTKPVRQQMYGNKRTYHTNPRY